MPKLPPIRALTVYDGTQLEVEAQPNEPGEPMVKLRSHGREICHMSASDAAALASLLLGAAKEADGK